MVDHFTGVRYQEIGFQIIKHFRLDEKSTRQERRKTDKFTPIGNLCDSIASSFSRFFQPYETTTIDEMLSLFRGRCPFKVFMKDKSIKYGILIRMITDAKHHSFRN